MTSPTPDARTAQAQFGRQAAYYAVSAAHRSGESLELLRSFAARGAAALPGGRYRQAIDVATGAGFAAFALAPFTERLLATDVAPEMIAQARKGAGERGLGNVGYALMEAERLPFTAGSLDAVCCRTAAHHFHDLSLAMWETARVLAPGGSLLLIDTAAPEAEAIAHWMNDVELRRDPSHIRDLKPSEWRALFQESGLAVAEEAMTGVHLEFSDWVRRAGTPLEEVRRLRHAFQTAPGGAVETFGIAEKGGQITFSWPVYAARAVKT